MGDINQRLYLQKLVPVIEQPPAWWLPRFLERFELANFNRVDKGFIVVVERKWR